MFVNGIQFDSYCMIIVAPKDKNPRNASSGSAFLDFYSGWLTHLYPTRVGITTKAASHHHLFRKSNAEVK